jgi:hypothetical protein
MTLIVRAPIDSDEIVDDFKDALREWLGDLQDKNTAIQALIEIAIEIEDEENIDLIAGRVEGAMGIRKQNNASKN